MFLCRISTWSSNSVGSQCQWPRETGQEQNTYLHVDLQIMCCAEAHSPLPWGYILLFQSVLLQRAVFSGSHESRCYWSGKLARMAHIDKNVLSRENSKCLSVSFSSFVRRKAVLPPSFSLREPFLAAPCIRERLSFLPNALCSLQLGQQRLRVKQLIVSQHRGITNGDTQREMGKGWKGERGRWEEVVFESTWFRGHGGDGFVVELDDLSCFFQP